ncbi:MAG: zinc metallopeptidase [Saprospiraceae bacterium]|nr:zinc metallopeptidase [Bacteroidia bacterium]NNL92923.1 zinc metallopeptidase [Saprospiraceae bacterium]
MGGYFLVMGFFSLIGMLMSNKLKSTFNKFSQYRLSKGLSGKEVAEEMLDYYGIHDVKVVPARGMLTDHYNPKTKVIALSEPVYNQRTIAASAVAAHECGHAIQHADNYPMLGMRSSLVPLVQVSSKAQQFLFMATMFGFGMSVNSGGSGSIFLLLITVTFGVTCLFALVTLPVEFDASRRALAYLENTGITQGAEYEGARKSLWWAAMTYVVNALASLAAFLYFLMKYMNSRN